MDKFWHWVDVVIKVLAAVLILFQLPPVLFRFFRKAQDWWSLRSLRATVKRLAKLEGDLKKLDEPPPMEERQVEFYNCVLIMMSAIAAGLLSAAWYFYLLQSREPVQIVFLALAVVCFLIAVVAGWWGMSHFQLLMKSHRKARRLEIEYGIKAMKDKLAKTSGRSAVGPS